MNKQLRAYYKQIDKSLNCPRALRKGFLVDVKRMVEDFLGERPEASLDDVRHFVGKPDELAATFMESLQAEVVQKHLKGKRYIQRVLIATFSVILVGLIAFAIYASSVRKDAVITKESTIIIYETVEE